MRTSQCIPPSEPGPERNVSSAWNVFCRNSIRLGAFCATMYGVTVWKPFRTSALPFADS